MTTPTLPPVIGIYSPVPACGKSTLAEQLPIRFLAPSQVLPFAWPIKRASVAFISLVAGATMREAEDFVYRDKSRPIPGLHGITARVVLQRIGEAGRRMHPNLWVLKWEKTAKELRGDSCLIVDDVRRPNEAAAVVRLGGEMWRLSRAKAEAEADPEVIADVSEGDLEEWQFDRRFSNDGTMDELLDTVRLDLLERPFPCHA
jgi:hypothetical protein